MALELPSVDAQKFLAKAEGWEEECKKAAECLHNYGVVVMKDERVNEKDNEDYCEMVERYFSKRGDQFYRGEEIKDIKPEIHYQQGATPEYVEKAQTTAPGSLTTQKRTSRSRSAHPSSTPNGASSGTSASAPPTESPNTRRSSPKNSRSGRRRWTGGAT